MSKTDLVNEVAIVTGTKKEAQAAVDCFFDTIAEALIHKEQVTVVGFGTFKVRNQQARSGRNPKTGEAINRYPRAHARGTQMITDSFSTLPLAPPVKGGEN